MSVKVGMVSLGCPKNQVDAELMLASLEEGGVEITTNIEEADVIIINTCGFIADAKKESIENIMEFVQLKKEGTIKAVIATGCMAERYKDEIMKDIPELDGAVGLGSNGEIAEIIKKVASGDTISKFSNVCNMPMTGKRKLFTPKTYEYLRVSDGCNNKCAYCAIPKIRGNYRSRTIEEIVAEAKELVAKGVKELVVVAQDTTLYGIDLYKEMALPKLLTELCKIDGVSYRLLYCYPDKITDELIDVMAKEDKIIKYIDIPIQHCSESVLKSMNRPGNEQTLRKLINKLRDKVPGIIIRTTVMVGFPGETDKDFEDLCNFVKDIKFNKLGCFAFSPEEDTEAFEMDNQIEDEVKNRRQEIITEIEQDIMDTYAEESIGKTYKTLIEGFDKYAECYYGRTYMDAPEIDGKIFFTLKTEKGEGEFIDVYVNDIIDFDLVGEEVVK